jgi:hypothetical protein
MSDPEGDSPNFKKEEGHSATASSGNPKRGMLKFDDPAQDIQNETPMEEEHTSNTR